MGMRRFATIAAAVLLATVRSPVSAQDSTAPLISRGQATVMPGAVPRFRVEPTDINLSCPAQPFTYFDKVGRKFALLGFESGNFEAWAYPLKILRGFEFSFLLGSSTHPVQGRDIVRWVSVDPAATTLTFVYQSFTVRAHFVTAIRDPGAVILLEVDATEPLTVVCSFLPVLQPMWPAGIGGQYAYWDDELKAYLISEPTRKNHGFVGSPAARGISYTPAHMLSDTPSEFKIEVADPKTASGVYLPIILAGGKGSRDDVRAVYRKLAADPEACYREAVRHYRDLRESTLQVRTPDKTLDVAFEWAKVALDNLIVENPDLGTGLVAGLGPSGTSGRPGFGWFFGTDAYLNSLSFNGFGHGGASKTALSFTRQWQRPDGKMAHELSQAAGYLKWWEDYPYGYIHGDTTPYYIVAVEDYVRSTGDLEFLKASWPSLVRAYEWCLKTDADGDGLMDNSRAGLGALEFGSLTGIQTDIYLAAVWARACGAMRAMAEMVGDTALGAAADKAAARAARAFDEKFWDAERGQYSYAFNKGGRLVQELTPWSAVGLAWGLGAAERGSETLAKMNAPDMATDWGVRMLSARSPLFEPLNYNYGAVWPFLNGWVATALFKYGFVAQGFQVLRADARHAFDNALGLATELYSGALDVWPQEGVPHQGFSTTGVVLPFVRGLLGLEKDVIAKRIRFGPALPADWPRLTVLNGQAGAGTFSLDYERRSENVRLRIRSAGMTGFKMVFSPAFGPGTRIRTARLNGVARPFKTDTSASGQAVRPSMDIPLTGDDTVELGIEPAPEIVPPDAASRPGDADRGLKIILMRQRGSELTLTVEGLSGETYTLEVANGGRVASVSGGVFDGRRLTIVFPPGKPGEFLRRDILIRAKS
jgi:hypothetical protein